MMNHVICPTEVLSAIPSSLFYLSTLIVISSVMFLLLSGINGKQITLSQCIEMFERKSCKVQSQVTLYNRKYMVARIRGFLLSEEINHESWVFALG